MTVINLKHKADDVIIQLGIAVQNLKNVPVGDIISCKLVNEEDGEISGPVALVYIAGELEKSAKIISDYVRKVRL
jgi:hypothetical protein